MKKALILLLMWQSAAWATTVRFETNLGDIDILMLDEEAPETVDNFLAYVHAGKYDDILFHRVELAGIEVVQGGGYRYGAGGQFEVVSTFPPVDNESGVPNNRGTIAMARTADPDSATNQWFFNVIDNGVLNGNTSNGYAVFGEVVSGMQVIDTISSLPRLRLSGTNLGASDDQFPVYKYRQGFPAEENMVKVIRAYELTEMLTMNAALSGGWFNPATPGQGIYLEVLPETGKMVMAWFAYDTELPQDQLDVVLGDAGHRWFVADDFYDGNVFEGSIFLTQNGIFDANDAVSVTAVGTVRVEFESCSSALVIYEFTGTGISGSFPMSRLSTDNVALCETLSSMADPGVTP